jgi:hypothetical protein
MSQAQGRSWWGRNWKWVVPLGCLTPLVVCGGVVTLIIGLVFGLIKSSEPYREGLARAKGNAEVQAALGEPIQEGFFVSGSINTQSVNGVESGEANFSIPISGPKGSATIQVIASKSAGTWTYSMMRVDLAGQPRTIDLLGKE